MGTAMIVFRIVDEMLHVLSNSILLSLEPPFSDSRPASVSSGLCVWLYSCLVVDAWLQYILVWSVTSSSINI